MAFQGTASLKQTAAVMVMGAALFTGTGSSAGFDANSRRLGLLETSTDFIRLVEPATRAPLDIRDTSAHLENIRAVLNPNISDLAAVFDVSRQMVYKWMAGTSNPEPQKLAKVQTLSRIADEFSRAGITKAGPLLKMKAFDGLSLLDILKTGRDCTNEVKTLIAESRTMEAAYNRSGLADSKAPPNDDWRSTTPLPAYPREA